MLNYTFLPSLLLPQTLSFPLVRFMQKPVLLKTLFKDIPFVKWTGPKENVLIHSLALHNEAAGHNSMFFAVAGKENDGNNFFELAIAKGANVIVSEKPLKIFGNLTHIQVESVRKTMAIIAKRFYGACDEKLNLIGVTGTNGKTTITWLLRYLLQEGYKEKTGLLGTLQYDLGQRLLPAMRTTPDVLSIHGYLQEMEQVQCKNAVMEVSSHALDQERVYGVNFKTGIFTNLNTEHLDYHQNLENYFAAKEKLFNTPLKLAIVNIDDPYGQRLYKSLKSPSVTFGLSKSATIRAENIAYSLAGTTFDLISPNGKTTISTPLIGEFNVYNCLAVFAVLYGEGRSFVPACEAIKNFPGVPGRMQALQHEKISVFIDYAHKPYALENVLRTLKSITKGNLYLVFGCGGNRDRAKRPIMTAIAQKYADFSWATSDNPRNESQAMIFEDMKAGTTDFSNMIFIEDRKEAITRAVKQCTDNDCLVIAGKGHESFQEINGHLIPFSDREVAQELLSKK